jgi:hypothetical protein
MLMRLSMSFQSHYLVRNKSELAAMSGFLFCWHHALDVRTYFVSSDAQSITSSETGQNCPATLQINFLLSIGLGSITRSKGF